MFYTKIPIYGIMILFSLTIGLLIIYKDIKKFNYTNDENKTLLIYILLGAFLGAKYFTYFTNMNKYSTFSEIGLSSYGAVIGIIVFTFIFSKQFNKDYKEIIFSITKAMPLMYASRKNRLLY